MRGLTLLHTYNQVINVFFLKAFFSSNACGHSLRHLACISNGHKLRNNKYRFYFLVKPQIYVVKKLWIGALNQTKQNTENC